MELTLQWGMTEIKHVNNNNNSRSISIIVSARRKRKQSEKLATGSLGGDRFEINLNAVVAYLGRVEREKKDWAQESIPGFLSYEVREGCSELGNRGKESGHCGCSTVK